jgi:hypothetical protein
MRRLYEGFLDPRHPDFRAQHPTDPVPTLGRGPRRFVSADQAFETALAQEPGAAPERRAELRQQAEAQAMRNVSFLDVTYSPPKSVTVLHLALERQENEARAAGETETADAWGTHRQAVEDAIWAGWRAGIDYLQDKAGYGRVGHHGGEGGRWADSHAFTVAGFFQHDSRNRDPQDHIHGAVLNRIPLEDGRWVTLDSRAMHRWRGAAGAVADRTTEERLQATLPVQMRMRPDGKAREIVGIQPVVRDFSHRGTGPSAPKPPN